MTHFVLVHGAFHGPWCFERLVPELARRGATSSAPELPLTSLGADADAVTRALDALPAAMRPVVLLGHSYGGAVISAAGRHPAVSQLIYLAALAPDDGEAGSGGPVEVEPAFLEALRQTPSGLLEVDPARSLALFYPDAESEAAAWAHARLRPGMTGLPGETIERTAWRERNATYIVCADDPIVTPASQRALAARTGAALREIAGDHSPFLARPAELAELLIEIARG